MELDKIIKGCIKGRAEAQKVLYENYKNVLFSVSLKYCASRADAEDNLHNTFIEIFTRIKDFRNTGSFEGWMKRIAINKAIDSYKRTFNLVAVPDHFGGETEVTDDEMDVSLNELLSMVQSLPNQYRLVFTLYELDDYSHKEIAEMLSISEGSSKSNLHRAKMLLREKLKIKDSFNPPNVSNGK